MQPLDCFGCEELFAGLNAHARRHVFHDVELAIEFERVSDGAVFDCFVLSVAHGYWHLLLAARFIVNPFVGIRLVERDDFNQWAFRVTALDVEWTFFYCVSQNQTTGAIFVVWVVFNNFSVGDSFTQFLNRNPAHKASINRVFRELELAIGYFGANTFYHLTGILTKAATEIG